jgi:hypothetical protein
VIGVKRLIVELQKECLGATGFGGFALEETYTRTLSEVDSPISLSLGSVVLGR